MAAAFFESIDDANGRFVFKPIGKLVLSACQDL